MTARPTRDEAKADASKAFGQAMDVSDSMTVDDATDAALRAGGPSRDVVRAQIVALRFGKASA